MGLQFIKKTQDSNDQTTLTPVGNFDDTPLATAAGEELTQCVADMYRACGSAISILNDLLLFDKLEDGELNLDKSMVAIGELCRSALSPFSAQVCVSVYLSVFFWHVALMHVIPCRNIVHSYNNVLC